MRPTLLLAIAACVAGSSPPNTCGDDLPRIVIGCWQVLERQKDEAAAVATLRAYYDAGFTYGRRHLRPLRVTPRPASRDWFEPHVTLLLVRPRRARRQLAVARGAAAVPDLILSLVGLRGQVVRRAATHLRPCGTRACFTASRLATSTSSICAKSSTQACGSSATGCSSACWDGRPENGMLAYARARQIRLACFGVVAGGWLSDAWLDRPAPPRRCAPSRCACTERLDAWCRGDWALFQELLRRCGASPTGMRRRSPTWPRCHTSSATTAAGSFQGRDTSHLDGVALLRGVPFDEDDGEVRRCSTRASRQSATFGAGGLA